MAVNLPQPLFVSGGRQRPAGEQALLQLLSQLPGIGMGLLQNQQQGPQREADLARTEQATATSAAQQGNFENQVDIRTQEFDAEQLEAQLLIQAKTDAGARSRSLLASDPANGEQLTQAWDVLQAMDTYGIDSSLIKPFIDQQLPQSEKDKLDLERTRMEMAGMGAEVDADEFATGKLIEMGMITPDSPLLPGAANTLQAILKSRDGESINWAQQGLDFVTSRIGQSAGGTGNFIIDTGGQASIGGTGGITVDQAVSEWMAIVERSAPEGVKANELKRLGSGAWQRSLAKNMAINELQTTLIMTPQMSDADIRDAFSSAFTPDEITEMIRTAKLRNRNPRR